MIAALSLPAWRAAARRRFCAVLAALAIAFHVLAMAAHQGPAPALAFDDAHALCLTGGEAPAGPADHGAPEHPQAPFCPICQTLHAAAPPPHAPLLAASPWAILHRVDPPALAAPAPLLVLTDLNPRGPPFLG